MAGQASEGAVVRAAPVHPGGAKRERQGLGGVEVVADDVRARLLRYAGSSQRGALEPVTC